MEAVMKKSDEEGRRGMKKEGAGARWRSGDFRIVGLKCRHRLEFRLLFSVLCDDAAVWPPQTIRQLTVNDNDERQSDSNA